MAVNKQEILNRVAHVASKLQSVENPQVKVGVLSELASAALDARIQLQEAFKGQDDIEDTIYILKCIQDGAEDATVELLDWLHDIADYTKELEDLRAAGADKEDIEEAIDNLNRAKNNVQDYPLRIYGLNYFLRYVV